LGIPVVPIYHLPVATNLLRQSLYGAFAFLLVLPAVIGPSDPGAIRWLLRSRPMMALGVISYGIYLWHQAMVTLVLRVTGNKLFTMPLAQLLPAVLASVVVVATLSYLGVERPVLRWGRRRRPRSPVTLAARGARVDPPVSQAGVGTRVAP
jgi:peptidoglycan/LPS O-acetylase OafA/YrhL